ncbi:exported hypothetical protein [uncultured Gammaproteobacteria bacterium]
MTKPVAPRPLRRTGMKSIVIPALLSALLVGCAAKPMTVTANPEPMTVPTVPPPSPEFNLDNARPIGAPARPRLEAAAVVPVPAPFLAPEPLRTPPVPTLTMPTAVASPPPLATTAAPPAVAPRAAVASIQQPALGGSPTTATADVSAGSERRVLFGTGSAEVSREAQAMLAEVGAMMEKAPSARLQVLAYAAGTLDTQREARQLSLARAFAVRDFLVERGVRKGRIDVRALGLAGEGPPDRADLLSR